MDMNNMLSSFKKSIYDFPAPEFKYLLAPPEDPTRRCLPLELRQRVLGHVLASTKRKDHGITSPKVIMLATSGCDDNQEDPRPLNFKRSQLNILASCKSLNVEGKKALLERLVIKFRKHQDFIVFMTQEVQSLKLPSPARFAKFTPLIHTFEFAFVIPAWYLSAAGCLFTLWSLIKLTKERNITLTISAGNGGWKAGIWRDNYHRLEKALNDVAFYDEIFPELKLWALFESQDFNLSFSGEIFAVPEFDLDVTCQAKVDWLLNEDAEKTYMCKLIGEADPYPLSI